MRLAMKDRQSVTKALCARYRKARKKHKGGILDEFIAMTGYDRCYARRLLRNHRRRVEVAPGRLVEGDILQRAVRVRKKTYGPETLEPLKKLWVMLDYIGGKRLQPALPALIERLTACKEIRLAKPVRAKLLAVSASTIDRLLRDERRKHTLKGRSGTKPGTLLKHQIAVRTFSDWDETKLGFMEMDLVGHDGGSSAGDYCQTLDMVDIASAWTEQACVRNKAEIHVFGGIEDIRKRLPFDLLGMDSDNGREFINHHLKRYCDQEEITFTRSRAYKKNDGCYVEQKNWSIVRRFVGYARFESDKACEVLNELYGLLSNYTNFFLPTMKLKDKTRDGARVQKRYHPAQTPYQRLLESPELTRQQKDKLRARYETLNPAQLHRRILALQKRLATLSVRTHSESDVV